MLTPYGTQRFRKPGRKERFVGNKGRPQDAVMLDLDGTLRDWDLSALGKGLEFAAKHYQLSHTIIIATSSYTFRAAHQWLVENLSLPFVGPFCRQMDDPRHASEFKRELAQGFEDMGLYRFVGAADDNDKVVTMWEYWAATHFEDAESFDLLAAEYSPRWSKARARRADLDAVDLDEIWIKDLQNSGIDTNQGKNDLRAIAKEPDANASDG